MDDTIWPHPCLQARVWHDEHSGWMWQLDGKPPVAGTSDISSYGNAATREACVAAVEECVCEVLGEIGEIEWATVACFGPPR